MLAVPYTAAFLITDCSIDTIICMLFFVSITSQQTRNCRLWILSLGFTYCSQASYNYNHSGVFVNVLDVLLNRVPQVKHLTRVVINSCKPAADTTRYGMLLRDNFQEPLRNNKQ